jgi:hypothetical protein
MEGAARQCGDRAAEGVQNIALEKLPDIGCQALRSRRNGKGGDAFDRETCYLPLLARHRSLRHAGRLIGLQF